MTDALMLVSPTVLGGLIALLAMLTVAASATTCFWDQLGSDDGYS